MNESTKDREQHGMPHVAPTPYSSPSGTGTIPPRTETPGMTTEQSRTESAKSKMSEFANKTSEKASEARQQAGERMSALAEQGRQGAEALGEAASSAVERLSDAGAYLQQANFDEMIHDLATVVRRYPLQSVLIGVGIGYLFARSMER